MTHMETPQNEPSYLTEDLKVTGAPKKRKINTPEPEPFIEKEMTTGEGIKTVGLIFFGYLLFSILPTLLFMLVFDVGFWLTQGLNFVLMLVIVFGFGLHKKASPEQLMKRDMRKKR